MRLSLKLPSFARAGESDDDLGKLPMHEMDRAANARRIPTLDEMKKCSIQPHTDDGGDAYYIGDCYGLASESRVEWGIKDDDKARPYLDWLKQISTPMPHLRYLADWMEVSCAPPKWRFIKEAPANRAERVKRCRASILDFKNDKTVRIVEYTQVAEFETALANEPSVSDVAPVRLIIVEDLSRDVVESLGTVLDIDPLFFLSHINDYLFHNTRDPWVELPDLDVDARKRNHFHLQYLRARYFETQDAFDLAEEESGTFNVLRRLDSDRSRKHLQNTVLDREGASVTLSRSKTSLWLRPRKDNEPIVAVLLVDPTVSQGSFALWGGYRPFEDTPSRHDSMPTKPPGTSLYEDAVYWSQKLIKNQLDEVRQDPRSIVMPMLRLVLADWRLVLKYMETMLGKIEWEFQDPHWVETPANINNSLLKLGPWRRNVPYYKGMIADTFDRLFTTPPAVKPEYGLDGPIPYRPDSGLWSLWHDFRLVQKKMIDSEQRINSIQTVASNRINIEEARRAGKQNQSLARLTFLATFFIPLNFTSSFLSMSPGFNQATETIWMFFAIGIPLTIGALLGVDLSNPHDSLMRRKLGLAKTDKKPPAPAPKSGAEVNLGRTIINAPGYPTHRPAASRMPTN